MEFLKCPHCGQENEYDFCEMNDQDGEYDIECHDCLIEFTVVNTWERFVYVDAKFDCCNRNQCDCGELREVR